MSTRDWGGRVPELGDWLWGRYGLVRLVVIDPGDPSAPWGAQPCPATSARKAHRWRVQEPGWTWHPSANAQGGVAWHSAGSSRPATPEEIARGHLASLEGL